MNYWNSVLNEVLNKDKNDCAFLFTNNSRAKDNDEIVFPSIKSQLVKEKRDLRSYYLHDTHPEVYFTKREAQCIFWVVQGLTNLQVSEKMGLSHRTVEFYVKNMKLKMNCASKKQLIQKVLQTKLLEVLAKEGMNVVKH